MNARSPARSYTLRLGDAATGGASILRTGPKDILAIGVGRTPSEAIALAGLLFPICPSAHQAAALGAFENAARVQLSGGQSAARSCIVLAEAIASCVWRSALTWRSLTGAAPLIELVAQARSASDAVPKAIFPGPWAKLGGAPMQIETARLRTAADELANAVANSPSADDLLKSAPSWINGERQTATHRRLGDGITSVNLAPDTACREETPRSLLKDAGNDLRLSHWFEAQAALPAHLIKTLDASIDRLTDQAPTPVDLSHAEHATGFGSSMTARGRLRHVVSIRDGRVAAWSAAAPTDWNFAPKGPVAQMADGLKRTDVGRRDAAWLITAFDPCVPCTVQTDIEPAHA